MDKFKILHSGARARGRAGMRDFELVHFLKHTFQDHSFFFCLFTFLPSSQHMSRLSTQNDRQTISSLTPCHSDEWDHLPILTYVATKLVSVPAKRVCKAVKLVAHRGVKEGGIIR